LHVDSFDRIVIRELNMTRRKIAALTVLAAALSWFLVPAASEAG
jgi:hypothetical protein